MVDKTYHVKFITYCDNGNGYISLVFERINYPSPEEQYIMCVMFPNWDQGTICPNEEGFLTVRYIQAGIDTWYDGTQQVAYKYTNIQFMKFVPIKKQVECITLD